MTVEVEGPDGVVIEFPEGTDNHTISRVMQQRYGTPNLAPAATPQNETINRLGQSPQSAGPTIDPERLGKMFGSHAVHSVTSMPDVPAALGSLTGKTLRRASGQPDGPPLEPMAAPERKDLMSTILGAYVNQSNAQGPMESPGADAAASKVIGPVMQPQNTPEEIAAALGDYAPAAIGAPGPLSAATRVAGAAGGGRGVKAIAEALGADELGQTWAEMGGGMLGYWRGRKFGQGVFEPVENTVKRSVDNFFAKKPEGAISEQTYLTPVQGAGAAKTPRIGREPAPPKGPPPAPVNPTLADRGDLTPEAFDKWYDRHSTRGIEPLEGEAYGTPGIDRWSSITRLPGKSGAIAKEAILGSIDDPQASGAKYQLQSQSLSALDKLTGGEKVLADKLDAAQQAYTPVLTPDAVSPALEAKTVKILTRIDKDRLSSIAADARELAQSRGLTALNKAQQLQFLKQQIYNRAQKLLADPEHKSLGASYMQIWSDLRDALHGEGGIKGYAQVDRAYESLLKQKTLDDNLRGMIMRGKEGKNPGYVGMSLSEQKALRDAFGPAADEFIIGQRLTDRRATDLSAVLPGSNSTTFKNAAHAGDNALESAQSFAEKPIRNTIGTTLDGMFGRIAEHNRDSQGAQFAKPMTAARAAEFRKQLEQLQAEKHAAALAQALAASQGPKPNPNQQSK